MDEGPGQHGPGPAWIAGRPEILGPLEQEVPLAEKQVHLVETVPDVQAPARQARFQGLQVGAEGGAGDEIIRRQRSVERPGAEFQGEILVRAGIGDRGDRDRLGLVRAIVPIGALPGEPVPHRPGPGVAGAGGKGAQPLEHGEIPIHGDRRRIQGSK